MHFKYEIDEFIHKEMIREDNVKKMDTISLIIHCDKHIENIQL